MNELPTTNQERKEKPISKPDLIIFDMDWTIIVEPDFYKNRFSPTFNEAVFEERGEEGLRVMESFQERFENFALPTLTTLGISFSKCAEKLLRIPLDEITPRPDIVANVRAIQSKKVIFTGSPRALALKMLMRFGFDPENDFDAIIGWEEPEVFPLKWMNSSFVFQSICQLLGVTPENTWSIGDTWETDLLPAKKIGITTIEVKKESGNADRFFQDITLCIENLYERSI